MWGELWEECEGGCLGVELGNYRNMVGNLGGGGRSEEDKDHIWNHMNKASVGGTVGDRT